MIEIAGLPLAELESDMCAKSIRYESKDDNSPETVRALSRQTEARIGDGDAGDLPGSTDNCAVCAFREGALSDGHWFCRHFAFDDEPSQIVTLSKLAPDRYSPDWCPGGEVRAQAVEAPTTPWHPIATAPRDGSWFVITRDDDPDFCEVGRYEPMTWFDYAETEPGLYRKVERVISEWTFDNFHLATHWWPVPGR